MDHGRPTIDVDSSVPTFWKYIWEGIFQKSAAQMLSTLIWLTSMHAACHRTFMLLPILLIRVTTIFTYFEIPLFAVRMYAKAIFSLARFIV